MRTVIAVRTALSSALLLFLLFPGRGIGAEKVTLLDPSLGLEGQWVERSVTGHTQYEPAMLGDIPSIRATAAPGQASGLYRRIAFDVTEHPYVSWTWRVEVLQQDADIRTTTGDDFAAAIFFIFPSSGLRPATALGYVWTNSVLPRGTFVRSPRHPDSVRFVAVEAGTAEMGRWVSSSRNLRNDYHVAFGAEPPSKVERIALWTDSDQTEQPAVAYYGAISADGRRPGTRQ